MGGIVVCCSEKFFKKDLKNEKDDKDDDVYIIENRSRSNIKSKNDKLKGRKNSPEIVNRTHSMNNQNMNNSKNINNKSINSINRSKNLNTRNAKELEKSNTVEFNMESGYFDTFSKFNDLEKINENEEEVN